MNGGQIQSEIGATENARRQHVLTQKCEEWHKKRISQGIKRGRMERSPRAVTQFRSVEMQNRNIKKNENIGEDGKREEKINNHGYGFGSNVSRATLVVEGCGRNRGGTRAGTRAGEPRLKKGCPNPKAREE